MSEPDSLIQASPFLKQLLSTPGPSSFESRPASVWREQAQSYGAEVRVDAYGNSFATFNAQGNPRVMLAGHIDEIGLIVSYIDSDGFLYFKAIGGWDSQQLIGQRVRILGRNADMAGVIGKKPIHLMPVDERSKVSKISDMWIDIGAKDADEAKMHVRVGDAVVIEQPFVELLNGRIVSKAIDNRIGAYIVLEAARRAEASRAAVSAVATVMEEIGHIGAGAAAYGLEPHIAIAVDVTHATDVPGINKKEHGDVPLGSGATLSIGSIVHRGVFNKLLEIAEAEGIPYMIEAAPIRTATDGDDTAKSRTGVPTAVISVPNRYMHSPNELIDLKDVEDVIRLMVAFIEQLQDVTSLEQP